MALTDQDARMMDALGQTELEDLGLETALQKVLQLEAEDIVQLVLALVQDADADEATDEGVAFEFAALVAGVEGEELTGGLADAGEHVGDAVDFALVLQAVHTGQLHLLVQTGLDPGAAGDLVGL